MNNLPHEVARLGPELQSWVEKQLISDLGHYGCVANDLRFDWSDACQEGHCAYYQGRMIESLSGVIVRNAGGALVADGWMDFVCASNEKTAAPILFWLFLSIQKGESLRKVKRDAFLPAHVWSMLSQEQKKHVATTESKWLKRDPKIHEWKKRRTG